MLLKALLFQGLHEFILLSSVRKKLFKRAYVDQFSLELREGCKTYQVRGPGFYIAIL